MNGWVEGWMIGGLGDWGIALMIVSALLAAVLYLSLFRLTSRRQRPPQLATVSNLISQHLTSPHV
jgi:hypothetical protein